MQATHSDIAREEVKYVIHSNQNSIVSKTRTDVGEITRKLQLINDLTSNLRVSLHAEAEHATISIGPEETFGNGIGWMGSQTRVRNPCDLRMLFEPPGIRRVS